MSSCRNLLACKSGKLAILAKSERLIVKIHNLISHITVAGENVHLRLCREVDLGGFGERVIDDKVAIAALAILAGVAINMSTLFCRINNAITGITHKSLPEENCKIVRTGIKCTVLKEAVVG